MRVHWLQHADHEGLGCMEPWLRENGHRLRGTRLQAGEHLPSTDEFDWLIVMGGPMNIYEHDRHPWLIHEKSLIRDAIVKNKRILGICLGAQLLADVLGGRVTQNRYTEIGWFDVQLLTEASKYHHIGDFPTTFPAFHWHGDTYATPQGAIPLMKSDACANQAFAAGAHRLGLQFHLEVTYADAQRWLAGEELAPGRYVQDPAEILRDPARFDTTARLMHALLERFARD